MESKFNDIQLDALREASNIGAGHAAIALSQMLGRKIMIAVPRSDVVPSEIFLKNMAKGADEVVAGVYLETLGDLRGALIYIFNKGSALRLSDMLLFRKEGETKFIDEKAQSAIKEACNILAGSFFAVLSDMLKLNAFHKNPYFAFDKAEVIMFGVCESVFGNRDQRICLATEFIESTSRITGAFAFVPTDETMNLILKKLKQK